jgi:hypothetical protein
VRIVFPVLELTLETSLDQSLNLKNPWRVKVREGGERGRELGENGLPICISAICGIICGLLFELTLKICDKAEFLVFNLIYS